MNVAGWAQIVLFVVVLTALTPLFGGYMARVYGDEPIVLDRVLGPVERGFYRLLGTRAEDEQDWRGYARAVLVFSAASLAVLYLILRTQSIHPFNPLHLGSGPRDLSFNTAASFVTNTNWQYYGGETTMTNFTQMAGLAVQNFASAAVGIAVLIAVVRGFARRDGSAIGNFWVDLTRTTLYVLLPVCIVGALFLVSQGVVQSLGGPHTFKTVAGGTQTLLLGPVASQEIIKELGTNGGGFYNVNAAMPFENSTTFTNFVLMLSILVIPAYLLGMILFSLVSFVAWRWGKVLGRPRVRWLGAALMFYSYFIDSTWLVYLVGLAICGAIWWESRS